MEEVVQEGKSGFICRDVEDMARRTKDATEMKADEVRAYVEEKFSLDRMARQYAELFREVIAAEEMLPTERELSDPETLTKFGGEDSAAA